MSKLTDLTEVTTLADGDLAMAVDVSNTSMDATGTNSKVTLSNVYAYIKTKTDTLYAAVLGADDNYVTDAEKIVIGNTSGTNTGDNATNTQYSGLDSAKVDKATYDAHSVLYATTDNTPVALTVGEQTLVGRATGGNISAIAIDSDLSSVSANDDTVPSAKATKAMGDLKLPLAGGTMTGNITLGENTSIDLDPAGSADGKYSGICITGTAGATLAFGDLIYLAVADSRWELVDSDSVTTSDRMIGMCVLAADGDASATKILLQGQIRADANFPALTIGAAVYAGETPGDIQVAIPTGADAVIRRVGYALTADEIYFCPSMDSQTVVA